MEKNDYSKVESKPEFKGGIGRLQIFLKNFELYKRHAFKK
jgi:hypothetical protein